MLVHLAARHAGHDLPWRGLEMSFKQGCGAVIRYLSGDASGLVEGGGHALSIALVANGLARKSTAAGFHSGQEHGNRRGGHRMIGNCTPALARFGLQI